MPEEKKEKSPSQEKSPSPSPPEPTLKEFFKGKKKEAPETTPSLGPPGPKPVPPTAEEIDRYYDSHPVGIDEAKRILMEHHRSKLLEWLVSAVEWLLESEEQRSKTKAWK